MNTMTRPSRCEPIDYSAELRAQVKDFARRMYRHNWEDAADYPRVPEMSYLGAGAYRVVYTDGDLVFKWGERPRRLPSGLWSNDGVRANRNEHQMLTDMRDNGETCAPATLVMNCGNYGSVVVMRRVDGWHPDEWHNVKTDVWTGPRAQEFEDFANYMYSVYGYGDVHAGNVLVDYETDEIVLIDGGM